MKKYLLLFLIFFFPLTANAYEGFHVYDSLQAANTACQSRVTADGRTNANCLTQGSNSGYVFRIGSTHIATYYSACHYAPVGNPNPIYLYGSCAPITYCPDVGDQPDGCLCSDDLPRNTGQWTHCDRPEQIMCDNTGTYLSFSQCLAAEPLDNNGGCPADSNSVEGQCVNKCGTGAHWNGVTNQCVNNESGGEGDQSSCPNGYALNVTGACAPTSCPPNKILVAGACVIDTDPQSTSNTVITTNPDGTTTETTTNTTITNNIDGSTSNTTVVTTTQKDAAGAVTGVSATQTDTTEEPPEPDSAVTGTGTCDSPIACSGDAIQCALLHQTWELKCRIPDPAEASISDINSCDSGTPFTCEGGVFECAALANQHTKYCEGSAQSLEQLMASPALDEFKAMGETDENGVLSNAIGTEEFNLVDELGLSAIFSIEGEAGGCPAPRSMTFSFGTQYFNYDDFVCPTIEAINPLILFAGMIFCSFMLYGAIREL